MSFYTSTQSSLSWKHLTQQCSYLFNTSEKYVFWKSSSQAFVATTVLSFDSNFFPSFDLLLNHFWKIRWIGQQFVAQFHEFESDDDGNVSKCMGMLDGHFFIFSSTKGIICSVIQPRISTILRHIRALWPFCTFLGD